MVTGVVGGVKLEVQRAMPLEIRTSSIQPLAYSLEASPPILTAEPLSDITAELVTPAPRTPLIKE